MINKGKNMYRYEMTHNPYVTCYLLNQNIKIKGIIELYYIDFIQFLYVCQVLLCQIFFK